MQAGVKRTRDQTFGAGGEPAMPADKANHPIFRPSLVKRVTAVPNRKKTQVLVPLPPPPTVQQFTVDTSEPKGSRGPEPVQREAKRSRTGIVQSEPEGWRFIAQKILANGPISVGKGTSRRSFAVVCSSNINRSIMAQKLLEKHDMRARSYGTGR